MNRLERIMKAVAQDTYTLWSIQEMCGWDYLQKHGVLQTDGRRIPRYWKPAYTWMSDKLKAKTGYLPAKYPVWAWFYPTPTSRWKGHSEAGEPLVWIKLRVPSRMVLLSDFEAWHGPLNLNPVPITQNECEGWIRSEEADLGFDNLDDAGKQRIIATWDRIFDLPLINGSEYGPIYRIQAVLPEVRLEDIVEYKFFVAK